MLADLTIPALESAFERVLENAGCAGVDAVSVADFQRHSEKEIQRLYTHVMEGRYRPLPLRKIVVEKKAGTGKTRRFLVPAVRDRVLQTAVARLLSNSFEEEFLESSFAYRPGRGVDRAIARVTQLRDRGFVHVLDADIREFFDRVDHSVLLDRLGEQPDAASLLPLIRMWVRAEFWDGKKVVKLRRGIPQGSPLSPLLANFFLNEFDQAICGGVGTHLARYADDFLILCETAEGAESAMVETKRLLSELGLTLNETKTRVTRFDEGFTWLGVYFFGNRAWIPWKNDGGGGGGYAGNLLFVAREMPVWMRARYEFPAPLTEMEQAFEGYTAKRASSPASVTPVVSDPTCGPAGGRRTGGVSFLYVTEQGSVIRKSGDRYLVEAGGKIVLDLPYHKLESVMLFGRVQITTQALHELLDRGIPVGLFSRQGRYRGALTPPRGKQVELRLRQYELFRDGVRSLALAKRVVQAKVGNGMEVLRRYAARVRGDVAEATREDLEALQHVREAVSGAGSFEGLLGLEGTAARMYFGALARFNVSGFAWDGRVRRPATDPLNALLSLTYVLLGHELSSVLEGLGADPAVGFLHRPAFGRPSLALDLLEPLRHPVADRLVWTLANRRTFSASDFSVKTAPETSSEAESVTAVGGGDGGGLRGLATKVLVAPVPARDAVIGGGGAGGGGLMLSTDGLKEFLGHYERWMLAGDGGQPYRRLVRRQAEAFVRALREEGAGSAEGGSAAAALEGWAPWSWGSEGGEVADEGSGQPWQNTLSATT